MASLRKFKKSRFWYACIAGSDGKQKQFSTGLTDAEEAMGVAVAAERALRKHSATPHQLRASLERLAAEFVPEGSADPGEWLVGWARGRKEEVAPATWSAYTKACAEASEWMKVAGVKGFAELTPARLTGLRDWWRERLAARTVGLKMKTMKVALGAAVKQKLLDENPACEVGSLRMAVTRRREFRPEEVKKVLGSLTGEWRVLFLLGLYTGQRLNDLAELTWRQVDLKRGEVTLTARKTGALVALPLMAEVVSAVKKLPGQKDAEGWVLPGIARISHGGRSNAFRKKLWEVGLARHPHAPSAGSVGGMRETGELSFHSLRHTATSMLKAAGVSDAIARAIIGHESAAVSRSYTHFDMQTMREALERMGTPETREGKKKR